MIRGLGLDIVEIERIAHNWNRFGMRFAHKILTEKEIAQLPPKNPVARLAALFAAKEAAVKALGTGFAEGIHFKSMEIIHARSGKPELFFLGQGAIKCRELKVKNALISLTHSRDSAAASVVLEG